MSSAAADPESPAREDKPLIAYVRVVLRYRGMVAAVFVAIVALAALRTFKARPVYKAEAQILVEREIPSVLTFKGVADLNERDGRTTTTRPRTNCCRAARWRGRSSRRWASSATPISTRGRATAPATSPGPWKVPSPSFSTA